MKLIYHFPRLKTLLLIIAFIQLSGEAYASHAQSADITYQCLGGSQYQISVSFYRDCSGINAPGSVDVNLYSSSCNQDFNITLNQAAATGNEVSLVCSSVNTVCSGGTYPGVEEYIYQGVVTLPAQCNDWIFSFSLCCRNNAINTINNPGDENIYVEAQLNNLDFVCNNSPTFSNPPVSYPCIGQTSCFNHGAYEPDGDSLYYSLFAPATGPGTTVTYVPGYSETQPLLSSPLVSFNSNTGDICVTPTNIEVTVLAVKVEEWRNGVLIGSVVRDIQLRTIVCSNNLPEITGINGTGQYSITACAGSNLTFDIFSNDIDAGQNVTLAWNNAIPSATFTTNASNHQTGTFNWTPNVGDISSIPYCFTVNVADDNCPITGLQVYSFCITVTGFDVSMGSTDANCGASNGTATATPSGGTGPYTYAWSPTGGNNSVAHGLNAGTYTVTVTDVNGCTAIGNTTVGSGAAPGNININSTDVSCFGGNNGTATVVANGGQQPYTYQWSNGDSIDNISNLSAGTYYVDVITSNGCITSDSIIITEPQEPLTINTSTTNVICNGENTGTASVLANGGTSGYTYLWNTTPNQFSDIATGLSSGSYLVTVTDANGCQVLDEVSISQPDPLSINVIDQIDVSCNGGNGGLLNVNAFGGTSPYSYSWNSGIYSGNSINMLTQGNYQLEVTDNNGCNQIGSFIINEPLPLEASVINQTDISCYQANDGEIEASVVGGTPPYSYLWSNSATSPQIGSLSENMYMLTVTDANGCEDTTSAIIKEPEKLVITSSSQSTICPGENINLQAFSTGGTGAIQYYWDNGIISDSQLVSPSQLTEYQVYGIDENGCIGATVSTIVLVNDINLSTLTVAPDTAICIEENGVVFANFTPGIGVYTFQWSNGLGTNLGPHYVYPDEAETYVIQVTDDCGNTLLDSVNIDVNSLPNIDLTPQTSTGCGEATFNLQNNAPYVSQDLYNWNFGDNTFSTVTMPEKSYSQSGSYTVTLIVTSAQGCINLATTNLNAIVNPIAKANFSFTPDEEISTLNSKLYFDNTTTDATIYNWDFGDGSSSSEMNPIYSYKDKGTYTITLFANNYFGCSDTYEQEVTVDPAYTFYIPNAFTPDENGLNEVFTAVGEEIDEFEMQIFNRWGEKIYETTSLNQGWDGSANGSNQISEQGVYVYNIRLKDYTGQFHRFTGKVTLLK
ncbi:T9SS type B sorting domain-containing protein [Vicingus serpentipes]|uniref:T9SS type B sorting domain-containing protein n=1 Tax=Vicingus serpentipes TaxID=1926625 RepID=A0A5C6RS14_9FLAO|nr:PKD domain-containing protein [Vicingus serpentipes]TXB64819.1 T9SS type B sorting domain-containing protein [Vicingus serpentipes]